VDDHKLNIIVVLMIRVAQLTWNEAVQISVKEIISCVKAILVSVKEVVVDTQHIHIFS
jgi:hypothetical protein